MKLLLLFLLTVTSFTQSFDDFKLQMQTAVTNLTIQMQDIFSRRCETQIATCQVFSYYECQGTAAKVCYEDFPKADACVGEGVYLAEQSAVRFPPDVDVESLSTEEKQFVCTSALLEDSFQALDNGRDKRYGRAYMGTALGSFRSYPATGGCDSYDPRFRPWYVAATAGAKNVILIIDVSGSMSGSGISLAKQAAQNVINTLSNSDFVGVVAFSTTAFTVHSDKIIRATQEAKASFSSAVGGLTPSGSTNYEQGLREAFSLLNAAQRDEFGAPCNGGENIFLFLTDGEPTEGISTSEGLLDVISQFNKDITLFTYALGSGATTDILSDLSCAHSGILFQIKDTSSDSSLATVMRNYYTFIAEGVTTLEPVWTEPYDDAFGLGRMVTVSMPVYYEESNIRTILGVIGIDVSMAQLETFGFTDEQSIIKELISNAPCHSSNLTQCEIDELRGTSCGVSGCTSAGTIIQCANPPQNIFLEPVENTGYICCGLSVALLVIIIVLAVVIIIVVICVVRWRIKKNQENPNS